MTNFRNFVTFYADFPDDSKWDEAENLSVPGGRAISERLRDEFIAKGCNCSPVEQRDHYGWEFDATLEGQIVMCLLQAGEEWLLLLEPRRSLADRLKPLFGPPCNDALENVQRTVHDVLINNSEFSKHPLAHERRLARTTGKIEHGRLHEDASAASVAILRIR